MSKIKNWGIVTPSQSQKIRNSYEKSLFPSRFSSWLTGKAHSEKRLNTIFSWWSYLCVVLAAFFMGLACLIYSQLITVQLAGTLLVLFSSRRLAAVVIHQAVHHRLSGNEMIDMLIGEFCAIITFSQDFKSYKVDHCKLHHSPETFATKSDPILIFLETCGLTHGMSKSDLILGLWSCIFSPFFHFKFMVKRAIHNLNFKRPVRLLFFGVYYALLVFEMYSQNNISGALLLFLGLILLYQISAFVEICSEHLWFGNTEERRNTEYFYADISWGRFCGLPYPAVRNNVPTWYLVNLFYHLPVRLFILVGDLPQHDFHHRHPIVVNWTNAIELRNEAIGTIVENEPRYLEVWGLHNAIGIVFEQLSQKQSFVNQCTINAD
ncbi:hypothetical protein DFP75_103128 [Marinomonas alcarazii]|uniref:Fatty acid desaturase n=1 Tax=Marinomonas alcarazii TaxID=491949 RepID=A0A318V0N3_9GAMM|nr:hypothetical protein [Marinomonas alcarazii]PYF82302.1 hypothetical protein DFP75_103128 [Marinomonas alcarazii]